VIAPPAVDSRDDLIRRRILGIHLATPDGQHAGPVQGEPGPDVVRVRRSLRAAGFEAGVSNIQRFVARRPVFMVTLEDGSALVLKWPHAAAHMRSDNELFWLRALAAAPLPAFVRPAVPRVVAEGDEGLLVLDAVSGGVTLSARLAAEPDQRTEFWVAFAAALANLHRVPVQDDVRQDDDRRAKLPLPANLDLTPREFALGCGTGFGHYVATLQSAAPQLDELRTGWRHEALIHFDLSGDNVLLGDSSSGEPAVRLIDWELAGLGDPMYDVGSVLSQMLTHALRRRISSASSGVPEDLWQLARHNALRFVTAYRELTGISAGDVRRAVQFAGLGQVLSALGRLERIGSLGRIGHLSLLVGRQLLRQPGPTAVSLLGKGGIPR
jgi:aminoglycoside phosphotransferase (APT) family kinase protein